MVNLDEIGSSQHEQFINQRLKEKTTAFHAPIKKNKLNTFAVLKKTETIKNKSNKEIKITAQRNVYAQLLMLAQENDIDLEKIHSLRLLSRTRFNDKDLRTAEIRTSETA